MMLGRPDRAAELVTRWVRCYTRRLPAPIAERRLNEITADLHEHIGHEQSRGTSDRRIALSILSRMVRGLTADASWRGRIRPWKEDLMKSVITIIATTLTLVTLGVLAIMYGSADDAPGLSLIGLVLIAGGLVLAVRAAIRRARGVGP